MKQIVIDKAVDGWRSRLNVCLFQATFCHLLHRHGGMQAELKFIHFSYIQNNYFRLSKNYFGYKDTRTSISNE